MIKRCPPDFEATLKGQIDRSLRNSRRADASFGCMLLDPSSRFLDTLVGADLVLTDHHRHTAIPCADRRVAHEPLHAPHQAFQLRFPLLDNVHQLLRTFAGVGPYTACISIPPLAFPNFELVNGDCYSSAPLLSALVHHLGLPTICAPLVTASRS